MLSRYCRGQGSVVGREASPAEVAKKGKENTVYKDNDFVNRYVSLAVRCQRWRYWTELPLRLYGAVSPIRCPLGSGLKIKLGPDRREAFLRQIEEDANVRKSCPLGRVIPTILFFPCPFRSIDRPAILAASAP